jgi:hypothetical protein
MRANGDQLIIHTGAGKQAIEIDEIICARCGNVTDQMFEGQWRNPGAFDWSAFLEHRPAQHPQCGGDLILELPLPTYDAAGNIIPAKLPIRSGGG